MEGRLHVLNAVGKEPGKRWEITVKRWIMVGRVEHLERMQSNGEGYIDELGKDNKQMAKEERVAGKERSVQEAWQMVAI